MTLVSVHEYVLKPDADPDAFEAAVTDAEERGLLDLPALETHYLVRGLRGDRRDRYAAIWVWESRAAWEALWGPPDDPVPKSEYPEPWVTWEDEVLAPFLTEDPDGIRFTTYETL